MYQKPHCTIKILFLHYSINDFQNYLIITTWRDPKIDKNGQNPHDTCSKIPGRAFSEGAEPPQAGHHPSHSSGGITTSGDLETGKNDKY